MDYLAQFDFDIRYVKGSLNKVADALSRYFEHDYWMEVPELQDYVNTDVRLDPEHDDLPLERLFEVEERVIESRVCRENSAKVVAEILALRKCVQARDVTAASIAASQRTETDLHDSGPVEEDPTIFESRVKGDNLRETMTQTDTFEEDIRKGYTLDLWFQKVKEKIRMQMTFKERDGFIWAQNRRGEDVLCIPSAPSGDMNLRTRILDQAHQVVGHYGPQ